MKSTKRIAVVLGVILVLGLFAYRTYRTGLLGVDPAERGAGEEATIEDPRTSNAAGVQDRDFDPAQSGFGWRSSEIGQKVLTETLSQPMLAMDVALLDLQANADLVPWLDGLVADDEFGRAVAECRNRYERQQRSTCHWEQDIVLRRDPQGESSVVAVQPRISPDQNTDAPGTPFSPECKAWAQCVATAWKGRPAPFPKGASKLLTADEDGSELIALRKLVYHLGAHGLDSDEYKAAYRDRMARLDEKVRQREQAYAEAEDEGARSLTAREGLYHNLLLERGRIEDARAYLRYLDEVGR